MIPNFLNKMLVLLGDRNRNILSQTTLDKLYYINIVCYLYYIKQVLEMAFPDF